MHTFQRPWVQNSASVGTVESQGRQIKQCRILYIEYILNKIPLFKGFKETGIKVKELNGRTVWIKKIVKEEVKEESAQIK